MVDDMVRTLAWRRGNLITDVVFFVLSFVHFSSFVGRSNSDFLFGSILAQGVHTEHNILRFFHSMDDIYAITNCVLLTVCEYHNWLIEYELIVVSINNPKKKHENNYFS